MPGTQQVSKLTCDMICILEISQYMPDCGSGGRRGERRYLNYEKEDEEKPNATRRITSSVTPTLIPISPLKYLMLTRFSIYKKNQDQSNCLIY